MKQKKGAHRNNTSPANAWNQLLKGRKLELATAVLLLHGKLNVSEIAIDREGVVTLALSGQFQKQESNHTLDLLQFFNDHGEMTMDEVFAALKKKLK